MNKEASSVRAKSSIGVIVFFLSTLCKCLGNERKIVVCSHSFVIRLSVTARLDGNICCSRSVLTESSQDASPNYLTPLSYSAQKKWCLWFTSSYMRMHKTSKLVLHSATCGIFLMTECTTVWCWKQSLTDRWISPHLSSIIYQPHWNARFKPNHVTNQPN